MQGTAQCLVDGTATVCTCNTDLCNTAGRKSQVFLGVLAGLLMAALL
jgi:hypothetical protein